MDRTDFHRKSFNCNTTFTTGYFSGNYTGSAPEHLNPSLCFQDSLQGQNRIRKKELILQKAKEKYGENTGVQLGD